MQTVRGNLELHDGNDIGGGSAGIAAAPWQQQQSGSQQQQLGSSRSPTPAERTGDRGFAVPANLHRPAERVIQQKRLLLRKRTLQRQLDALLASAASVQAEGESLTAALLDGKGRIASARARHADRRRRRHLLAAFSRRCASDRRTLSEHAHRMEHCAAQRLGLLQACAGEGDGPGEHAGRGQGEEVSVALRAGAGA